ETRPPGGVRDRRRAGRVGGIRRAGFCKRTAAFMGSTGRRARRGIARCPAKFKSIRARNFAHAGDWRLALSRNQRMPRHSPWQCDGKSITRSAKNARCDSARSTEIIAMKCAEVRKFVRLYLDSELDTEHSFEVEQHLESCVECAGLFEAEKKFDVRLGRFLRRGHATRALWENIEVQIEPVRRGKLRALW